MLGGGPGNAPRRPLLGIGLLKTRRREVRGGVPGNAIYRATSGYIYRAIYIELYMKTVLTKHEEGDFSGVFSGLHRCLVDARSREGEAPLLRKFFARFSHFSSKSAQVRVRSELGPSYVQGKGDKRRHLYGSFFSQICSFWNRLRTRNKARDGANPTPKRG